MNKINAAKRKKAIVLTEFVSNAYRKYKEERKTS